MASGLETEPQSSAQEDTLTASNKSQSDSLSGSTSGLERSESGFSLASKLQRSPSSGLLPSRSLVRSPQTLTVEQDSWDNRVSETDTGTSGSGQSNAAVQISPA